MAKGKKHTPEQIVSLLRQIEVAVANGKTTPIACREGGITEQTYYRWRKEFGGLQVDQARRLKELVRHVRDIPLRRGRGCAAQQQIRQHKRPLLIRNVARITDFLLACHPSILDRIGRQRKHLSWCKLHNRL
jgi:hypothetical protein